MTPDDEQRAAEQILAIPYFGSLMKKLEDDAITAIVNAKYDDHEARQAFAAEVRSIRKLRSRLEAVSKEGQLPTGRKAPA